MVIHPTVGSTSWALPLRAAQWVFAALVMSLSAYTLSVFTGWREVRFTVAAVFPSLVSRDDVE